MRRRDSAAKFGDGGAPGKDNSLFLTVAREAVWLRRAG
jgi:hypothetical protein